MNTEIAEACAEDDELYDPLIWFKPPGTRTWDATESLKMLGRDRLLLFWMMSLRFLAELADELEQGFPDRTQCQEAVYIIADMWKEAPGCVEDASGDVRAKLEMVGAYIRDLAGKSAQRAHMKRAESLSNLRTHLEWLRENLDLAVANSRPGART